MRAFVGAQLVWAKRPKGDHVLGPADAVLRTVRPLEGNSYSSIRGSGILASLGLGSPRQAGLLQRLRSNAEAGNFWIFLIHA